MTRAIILAADDWLREYRIPGVPSSGLHQPTKADGRLTFAIVDAALASLSAVGAVEVKKATLALLNADLAYDADTLGLVYDDATAANNGIYVKTGASGAGAWEITSLALPAAFAADLSAVQQVAEQTIRQKAATFAELQENIDHPAGSLGLVFADTGLLNGVYLKVGAEGSGGWERTTAIPEPPSIGVAAAQATFAALQEDIQHPAGSVGIVYNDANPAFIGVYTKTGDSGAGGWVASAFTLEGFVNAADVVNAMIYLPDQTAFTGSLAIGDGMRNVSGSGEQGRENLYVGIGAGYNSGSAKYNVLIGAYAGFNVTDDTVATTWSSSAGIGNHGLVLIGRRAGYATNGALDWTAVGVGAAQNLTTGMDGAVVGVWAFQMCEGASEVAGLGHGVCQYVVGQGSIDHIDSLTQDPFAADFSWGHRLLGAGDQAGRFVDVGGVLSNKTRGKKSWYVGPLTRSGDNWAVNEGVLGYDVAGRGSNTHVYGNDEITAHYFPGGSIYLEGHATTTEAANAHIDPTTGQLTRSTLVLGEADSVVIAKGSAVALTDGVVADVASVELDAGEWDVTGMLGFTGAGTTTVSLLRGGVVQTSATLPALTDMASEHGFNSVIFSVNDALLPVPKVRLSLAAPTTIYLVAQAYFGTSTCSAFGKIEATRVG